MIRGRIFLFSILLCFAFSKESLDFQEQLRDSEKFSKKLQEQVMENMETMQQELFSSFGVSEGSLNTEELREKTLDGSTIFHDGLGGVKRSIEEKQEPENFPVATEDQLQKAIGIQSKQESTKPQKRDLKKCKEGRLLEKKLGFRNLKVLVKKQDKIEREVKICQGCQTTKQFPDKAQADEFSKEQIDEARKNPSSSIAEFSIQHLAPSFHKQLVSKGKYTVSIAVKHHDDSPDCKNFTMEHRVIQPESHIEEESWIEDESLQALSKDSKCVVIGTKPAPSFSARLINGIVVKRPVWVQQVTFACGNDLFSECQKLREKNCSMISKKCLAQEENGKCLTWEKTYSCGGSSETNQIKLQGEDLLPGMEGKEFEDSYDLDEDFGEVVTTLSSFAEVKKQAEEDEIDLEKLNLFNGQHLSCSKVFSTKIKDCCQVVHPDQEKDTKGKGGLIALGLESCNEEEKCLARKRGHESCVFIGDSKNLITKKFHYCCFSSKLARVIQQEAHKQLDLDWGNAKHPKCRGLTKEEIAKLDFSIMDLSEAIEDLLEIDELQLKKRLHSFVEKPSAFQSKMDEKNQDSHSQALDNLRKIHGGSS